MVELEQNVESLRRQGLGLAAISYDSPEILKNFAGRKGISYPLLSDPDSKTIRAYGVFNETTQKGTLGYGIPYPVTFIVNPAGVVEHKYFEESFRERQTLAGLLAKDYDVAPGAAVGAPKAKHVTLATGASTDKFRSGQRILLAVEMAMPEKYHVYAPGVDGYYAVEWKLAESAAYRAHEVEFPKSRVLFLEAINEKVPVYEGKIRLIRDITFGSDKELRAVMGQGTELTVTGALRYQACSDRLCYPPETVPLAWKFTFEPHDPTRVPEHLRRKVSPADR